MKSQICKDIIMINNLETIFENYRDAALDVDEQLALGVIYRGPCPALYKYPAYDYHQFFAKYNITHRIDLRANEEVAKLPLEDLTIHSDLLPIDSCKYLH